MKNNYQHHCVELGLAKVSGPLGIPSGSFPSCQITFLYVFPCLEVNQIPPAA